MVWWVPHPKGGEASVLVGIVVVVIVGACSSGGTIAAVYVSG